MWEWMSIGFGALAVFAILLDKRRYRKATGQVLVLLSHWGPLTGLELVRKGVPRAYVYLILNQLERDGLIISCRPEHPIYDKQKAWRVK